jgi:hypothetical protein
MKYVLLSGVLYIATALSAQLPADNTTAFVPARTSYISANNFYSPNGIEEKKDKKDVRLIAAGKWRVSKNKIVTGALVFLSGSAKGFNEGLQFNYFGFESIFPKANDRWFYPGMSFKNKYKDGDPSKGARFPLSTSVLVMFTDQYHLNNFIQRASLTAALVIKIGDGKKPLKHYVFDALYYTVCYQAGFHAIYDPIRARSK